MTLKKTTLASAIALALAGGQVAIAATTTTSGAFIADKLEATVGSGVVNISIMGLNAQGEVDLKAEEGGSSIIATVISNKGTVEDCYLTPNEAFDPIGTDSAGQPGSFAATVKYCKLVNGKARVSIHYDDVNVTGTDSVTVNLIEWDPSAAAGTIRTKISEAIKTITLNPPGENTRWIDIEGFEKGLGADDLDNSDGVNGTIVAGAAGAQITVLAYNAIGGLDDTAFGTVTLNLIAKGDAEKLGNEAVPVYSLEANMVKGKAIFTIEKNQVVKEDPYLMQALFTQGDYTHDSVELFLADTLAVKDKGVATKLKISEKNGKARISNDANATSAANVKVEFVDEFGNSVTAPSALKVTLTDANGILIASPVDVDIAKDAESVTRTFGDSLTPVVKAGVGSLTAAIKALPSMGVSDPLPITILEENLVAFPTFSGTSCDGIVPPLQAQKADVTFDGFCVGVDTNSDGVLTVGTDKVLNTGNATPMTIQNRTKSIIAGRETVDVSIDANQNLAKGRFRGATELYGPNSFLISDKGGQYGQVLVSNSYYIKPGEIDVAELRNVINHTVSEVVARPPLDADGNIIQPVTFVVDIAEESVKMLDTFGNVVTDDPSTTNNEVGTFNALSTKGTPDSAVTDDGGDGTLVPGEDDSDVVRITYQTEGPTAFAGEDLVDFAYTIPLVTGGVTAIVPELPKIAAITANIEQTAIPVNGEVAVTIEVRDQYGELIDPEGGVTVNFSGDLVPTVVDNFSGSTVPGGAKVDLEEVVDATTGLVVEQGGRSVLVVKAGSEEGMFKLSFVSADDPTILDEKEFTVTRQLIQECAPAALNLCTTEPECTAVGGAWDGTACGAPAADVCSATNLTACTDVSAPSCADVGGEWDGTVCTAGTPEPIMSIDLDGDGVADIEIFESDLPAGVADIGVFDATGISDGTGPKFRGFIRNLLGQSVTTTKPGDPVAIVGGIEVAPQHINESLDVLVVGELVGAGQYNGYYFVKETPFFIGLWTDGQPASIGIFKSFVAAPDFIPVQMYGGALPFPGAHLKVFFGYRVTSGDDAGKIYFNLNNTPELDIE